MRITSWALKNNRVSLTILLVIISAGLYVFQSIPQSELPSFTIKTAAITTVYPGASPQDVEKLISYEIEKKLQEIPEVDYLKSESRFGVSVVYVQVREENKNLRPIWDNLRRKVKDIKRTLPKGIYGPFINDEFGEVFGTLISVKGNEYSYKELKEVADFVRGNILKAKEVAKVKIFGAQKEKIFIEYDNAKLAKLNIPPLYIKKILNEKNIILPSGEINLNNMRNVYIMSSGNLNNIEELKNTIVRIPERKEVFYLKDLVNIRRGYVTPAQNKVRVDGENALILATSLRKGGNIITLGKEVKEILASIKEKIPYGVNVEIAYFQPKIVKEAVNVFLGNLAQSIVIVILVLLFLLGLKTGLLVATMIPVTIIMTFLLMFFFNVGINQVSLASLLIALGMLVDNSIVVSESILVQIQNGEKPIKASINATKELYKPLLISSLITSSAFLPIFLSTSIVGEYTAALFQIVTITLLSSWVLSITLIPLFSVTFMRVKEKKDKKSYDNFIYKFYRATLNFVLKNRIISIILITLISAVAIFLAKTTIKKQFFPSSDTNSAIIKLDMPEATPLARTEAVIRDIDNIIKEKLLVNDSQKEGVINWISYIGQSGPRYVLSHLIQAPDTNLAFMLLNITHSKEYKRIKYEIESRISIKYPEARLRVLQIPLGMPVDYPVEVRVSGTDQDKLYDIVKNFKKELLKMRELKTVVDDLGEKTLRLKIEINPVKAYHAEISNFEVALSLYTAISGFDIDSYREENNSIDINLKLVNNENFKIDDLESINVFSHLNKKNIPLKQIAKIVPVYDFPKIKRRARYKSVTVRGNLKEGANANEVNQKIKKYLDKFNKEADFGYSAVLGGEAEQSEIANKSIIEKLPVTFFIIILLLMLQFNSFRKPLILFTVVPLAIIGSIFGLLLTGLPFGFMTLLGFISLSGIVINNANVLMDRIRIEIDELKLDPRDAIVHSSQMRLRPIFLTTLTTVGGLIPLWLNGGPLWESMAVSLIFGLIFATSITLIVVPLVYSILHKVSFRDYKF